MEKYTGYIREPFYYETDQMGIIHHSNYIRWFEEARVALLEHLDFSYKKIEEQGIIIPVLGVSCEYKEMIRYGDSIRIQPIIESYTGTRLNFRYEIYGTEDQRLRTTGTSQHCFLLAENQRLAKLSRINPELDALFHNYAKLDTDHASETIKK
ncbi:MULTISPECIES: acyl-CoA thioesterase [unclassified Enterococcus]|uniref:acyl-CoA thioesterase n=1 Tax=unclassified Enterococcus TaxID=2608891 RepID=UPI001A9AB28D|nr:thioesterase family protein [Enterococcus sp. DIV1271a]MBO1300990.1 acyl-CoA thioesterase [Enterococcus sp. DIV1271a]